MLLLHLEEHGKGRAHAHLLGVAGVDAGDDGLGHLGERLAPEPPAHEDAEALVVAGPAPRQHQVEPHAQLAAPADEARQGERHESGRNHQDQTLGQLVQPPAREDVALADVFVGVEQTVVDAHRASELHGPGLVGDERVGAALDDEAVDALRADLAAQVVGALEQDPVEGRRAAGLRGGRAGGGLGAGPAAGGLERMSGAEAGHAAADHGDDREVFAHRALVTIASADRASASRRDRARPGAGSAGGRGGRSRCRRAPR